MTVPVDGEEDLPILEFDRYAVNVYRVISPCRCDIKLQRSELVHERVELPKNQIPAHSEGKVVPTTEKDVVDAARIPSGITHVQQHADCGREGLELHVFDRGWEGNIRWLETRYHRIADRFFDHLPLRGSQERWLGRGRPGGAEAEVFPSVVPVTIRRLLPQVPQVTIGA